MKQINNLNIIINDLMLIEKYTLYIVLHFLLGVILNIVLCIVMHTV